MRHPFRSFVILVLALGVLAMLALAILLPPLVASRIADRAKDKYGMILVTEGNASLSFQDGLSVEMQDVTLTANSAQGVPLATVGKMIVASPLSQVFGNEAPRKVILVDPVFDFMADATTREEEGGGAVEVTEGSTPRAVKLLAKPFDIILQNGSLKAEDASHELVVSVSDISGTIQQGQDGGIQANLRGLFNGQSTDLTLTVEDARRLHEKGSPADVSFTSKAGQISLSGRLGLASDLVFDGSVSAESTNARAFLGWFGLHVKGLQQDIALGLDAGLSVSHSKAALKNLAFALGSMQAKGLVEVQAKGQRPDILADLAFNLLDLNIYHHDGKPGDTPAPPDLTAQWSESILPFDDLKTFDGRVTITTDRFVAGAVDAGQTTLKASLKGGTLQARVDSTALFGGTGSLDLGLTHGASSDMTLKIAVAQVAAKDFLGKAFGISFLSGPTDLTMDVQAKGRSPAELVSTLAGTAHVTLRDGSLDGIDLATRAGLLKSDDVVGWGVVQGNATAMARAAASATFRDGIATLQNTQIEASGLRADITGEVDLLRRAVDLKVTPGEALTLPVAARAKGPWDKPRLSAKLDVDSVLRDGSGDELPDAAEKVAKGAVKKAKKKLKKLFGN